MQQHPHRLAGLFGAKAVALVGASEKSPWSKLAVDNHRRYGFESRLHLVNPRGDMVFGQRVVSRCAAIDDKVDVAYIAVPRAAVLDALADVAEAHIPYSLVLTSGFAEVGESGRREQAELVAFARRCGISLLGPNSLGFVNLAARTGITAMPPALPLLPGALGIVSQSGSTTSEIMTFAHQQGTGYTFAVALGNEAMIGCADVIEYLVDSAEVRCILMFLEAVRDPGAFMSAAARARATRKPIVLVKLGRNPLSSAVAQSHTGALVGDDRIFDAVCRRYGIIRVATVEHAVTTAQVLCATGRVKKKGVAFVSISGGACGLVADLAPQYGVDLPELAPQTQEALRRVTADYGAIRNPFDVTGAAVTRPEIYAEVLSIIGRDPGIGIVAAVNTLPVSVERDSNPAVRARIAEGLKGSGVPGGIVSACLRPITAYGRELIAREGLPFVVGGFEQALQAFSKATWWSSLPDSLPVLPAAPSGFAPRPHSERETLSFLSTLGIPVVPSRLARTASEAAAAAEQFACPVALKISSPHIAHKTEAGGVRLGITDAAGAGAAFNEIMASVRKAAPQAQQEGVLVVPMRKPALELIVGTHRDPQWGPALLVGLGGIWTEALGDTCTRLLPVAPQEVVEMLESLRAAALFKGYRGAPPTDLRALADIVVRIGDAALMLGPDLESLEVNPLFVSGAHIEVIDALAVWARPITPGPADMQ